MKASSLYLGLVLAAIYTVSAVAQPVTCKIQSPNGTGVLVDATGSPPCPPPPAPPICFLQQCKPNPNGTGVLVCQPPVQVTCPIP